MKLMGVCYLCGKKTSTFETEWEVNDLKSPPLKMTKNDILCNECGKNQEQESKKQEEQKELATGGFVTEPPKIERYYSASKWYWLLPILVGIIGGIIVYIMMRDKDRPMAKSCFILGIIVTFSSFMIFAGIFGML